MTSAWDRAAKALSRLSHSSEALAFAANQIERVADELHVAAPGVVKLGDGAERLSLVAEKLVDTPLKTGLGAEVVEKADRALDLAERFVEAVERLAPRSGTRPSR